MPRDELGNVADFVMAPDGTVARTNYGRGYLMYLGGAARELRRIVEVITKLDSKCSPDDVEYLRDDVFNEAWSTMIRYHRCINEDFADKLEALPEKKKRLHLYECLEYGVINFRPVDTKKPLPFAVMELEQKFPQTFGPVTHAMIEEGRYEKTLDFVRIAPLPIMILDKTTDDTLVAATASHGAFGVLVKHNQSDRYSKPWKDSPPRGQGEAENRVYGTHTTDPRMAAEMVDRSTNPAVQLHMVRQFVNSEHPSAIEDIVDREQFPYGGTKPLELQNNFFQSYGARFKYVPEDMRDILESDLRELDI